MSGRRPIQILGLLFFIGAALVSWYWDFIIDTNG